MKARVTDFLRSDIVEPVTMLESLEAVAKRLNRWSSRTKVGFGGQPVSGDRGRNCSNGKREPTK